MSSLGLLFVSQLESLELEESLPVTSCSRFSDAGSLSCQNSGHEPWGQFLHIFLNRMAQLMIWKMFCHCSATRMLVICSLACKGSPIYGICLVRAAVQRIRKEVYLKSPRKWKVIVLHRWWMKRLLCNKPLSSLKACSKGERLSPGLLWFLESPLAKEVAAVAWLHLVFFAEASRKSTCLRRGRSHGLWPLVG